MYIPRRPKVSIRFQDCILLYILGIFNHTYIVKRLYIRYKPRKNLNRYLGRYSARVSQIPIGLGWGTDLNYLGVLSLFVWWKILKSMLGMRSKYAVLNYLKMPPEAIRLGNFSLPFCSRFLLPHPTPILSNLMPHADTPSHPPEFPIVIINLCTPPALL